MFKKKASIEHEYMHYSADDVIGEAKEKTGSFLSTLIRLLIILLLMGLLFLGSVFGYRYLQKDDKQALKSNIQKETAPEKQATIKKVQHTKKMYTQEEMEAIVETMMEKLEKEKKKIAQEVERPQKEETDAETLLLASLASMEADHIIEVKNDLNTKDINTELEVIKTDNAKPTDKHNQVTLYTSSYAHNVDDISQQIGQIVTDMQQAKQTPDSYTSSLTNEVSTRKDAMRILVVRPGDTLSKIAQRAYGSAMAYQKIYEANPNLINNPNKIYVGQKLRIPQI